MKRITIEKAKEEISLVAYLAKQGHFPVGMSGRRHKFKSVFREEKAASMFVSDSEGLWNDFGHGGGSIIDLAQQMHGFSNIPETLEHLTKYVGKLESKPIINLPNQSNLFDKSNSITTQNIRVQPLNHTVLLKYLREERGIAEKVAKQYLRLVWYDNQHRKNLFAIGWVNDSGAFELRSATSGEQAFKAVTGKKNISTLVGNSRIKTAFVFESMLDFLSALMLKNQMYLEGTTYILNSTSLVKRVIPFLEKEDYQTIHTFFDNDKAGEEAKEKLLNGYSNPSKIKIQEFYKDFVDVNAYLVGRK